MKPKCTAKNRQGNPCGKYPIAGATVCRNHGGAAPQVQAKARLRLAELVHPAIVTLGRIVADPMASETSKLRAVENILDRTGYPRAQTIDVDQAKTDLIERLATMADEGNTK